MSIVFGVAILCAMTILTGCGDTKPLPTEIPTTGRYQIVSGQYRYYAPNGIASFTGSAIFKIDTTTGETFQFIPEPDSLGGSWLKVK